MAQSLLLKGGTLMPMDQAPFVGDILLQNGKIAALGTDLFCPEAQVVDVADKYVLPGLIDAHSHIGLVQAGTRDKDHNEATYPVLPQLRAIDAINPREVSFQESLEGGVTTAITGPGSMNIIGGTFAAIKPVGNTVKKMLLKDAVAMKAAMGENPKFCMPANNAYPKSRLGVAAKLRETLVAAQNYARRLELSADDPKAFVPRDLAMEAMLPVLRREMPLKIHCHWDNDILTAVRICEEFHLRYTLDHCTNAWLITDELKEAMEHGCDGLILGPFGLYKGKHESNCNISYRNAKYVYDAGIPFAIMTDHFETQPDSLITHAALTAAEGVPDEVALQAVTLTAAKIVGLDDRIGSLTVGKDADVAVFSQYPLDTKAKCVMTIVNGQIAYTRA